MPTVKQKKALKNMVENGGNMSKAMIDSGYSPKTAKTPKKLTTSKGWDVLMEENFPDDSLLKIHKKLLNLTVTKDFRITLEALKLAYKIKNKFPVSKSETIDPRAKHLAQYLDMSSEELEAIINSEER